MNPLQASTFHPIATFPSATFPDTDVNGQVTAVYPIAISLLPFAKEAQPNAEEPIASAFVARPNADASVLDAQV